MSELVKKSQANLEAAEYLIQEKYLFTPSVHCSYYACVQLMKHLLLHQFEETEDSLKQLILKDRSSFHTFARKFFRDRLRRIHAKDAQYLYRTLQDLYNFRVESDYKEAHITQDTAGQALRKANSIIQNLEEHFNA